MYGTTVIQKLIVVLAFVYDFSANGGFPANKHRVNYTVVMNLATIDGDQRSVPDAYANGGDITSPRSIVYR